MPGHDSISRIPTVDEQFDRQEQLAELEQVVELDRLGQLAERADDERV